MPSEMSTAVADENRGRTVEELERELSEAHRRGLATAEVLRIIGNSPTNAQPVFDTIAASATRLCGGLYGVVFRFDGEMITVAADSAESSRASAIIRSAYPAAPGRGTMASRALLERRVIALTDAQDSVENPAGAERARAIGYRAGLSVPMLRGDTAIGAINIVRRDAIPFSENEIDLLKTFADQAVIAIENTRLFEELQARTRELQESLRYQTATSEVLGVISRSKFDLQPVLNALAQSAGLLCESDVVVIRRRQGETYSVAATYGLTPEQRDHLETYAPNSHHGSVYGRAIVQGCTVHVPDVLSDPDFLRLEQTRVTGIRANVSVPLKREGVIIGTLSVIRREPRAFSPKQIELLETFADQAVIAIENTRLFEELQEKNHELTEAHLQVSGALERETATSQILRVIGSSPTDVQPVFDTIARSGVSVCGALGCVVLVVEDGMIRVAATHGVRPERLERFHRDYPIPLSADTDTARTIRQRRIFHLADIESNPNATASDIEHARLASYRTRLMVPMVRGDRTLGLIAVTREDPTPFPDQLVELLKTFADQAVIAIENTRLFEEVQARTAELAKSLEYQTATSDVLNVISRSPSELQPVLNAIVEAAWRLCEADYAYVFMHNNDVLELAASNNAFAEHAQFMKQNPRQINRGSLVGRTWIEKKIVHIEDIHADAEYDKSGGARLGKQRSMLGVPLLNNGAGVGVIALIRSVVRPFTPRQIELVSTFADQAVIAIENTRLFNEIVQKGRELEIASQHKSQFVANMSHELRTPLAAILGYAELMQEGFYEPLGQKSLDALGRIGSNGKHLLGLINTVLDIAKIESGQFALNLGEYSIETVVETVRAATESLAETKKLSLWANVAKKLPVGLGDEQRLTQVLLNLVGNAIKFTDAGEVRITAKVEDGHFAVSVADTGPGIPADQLIRVFDQFHQVDNSNTKKKGGTGLGLAIAKQIVEMHGGRVWVESEPGKGAIFQIQVPVRAESRRTLQ